MSSVVRPAGRGVVEPRVDLVGALTGAEALVVLATALCARTVSGGEGRRLVEEEELGVAAGRHQR